MGLNLSYICSKHRSQAAKALSRLAGTYLKRCLIRKNSMDEGGRGGKAPGKEYALHDDLCQSECEHETAKSDMMARAAAAAENHT
jgi:hypothetical protein